MIVDILIRLPLWAKPCDATHSVDATSGFHDRTSFSTASNGHGGGLQLFNEFQLTLQGKECAPVLVPVPHCRKDAVRIARCSTHIGTAVILITSKSSRHTQALGSTHSTSSTNIQGLRIIWFRNPLARYGFIRRIGCRGRS